MRLTTLLFLVLPVMSYGGSAIFFHSDFEQGETYAAVKVKPGQNEIDLVPNHRLQEWPIQGGTGIIEANRKAAAESFLYSSRKGRRLLGVSGIRKHHARGVGIRTGNLDEWLTRNPFRGQISRTGIELTSTNPLFGNFSVRLIVEGDSYPFLTHAMARGHKRYHCRFYFRTSPELLSENPLDLPICYGVIAGKSWQRARLRKVNPNTNAYLDLETPLVSEQTRFRVLREQRSQKPGVPVQAGETYCIEYSVVLHDTVTATVSLSVNGMTQTSQYTKYQSSGGGITDHFKIGQTGTEQLYGTIVLDEIVFSNGPIGTIPAKPTIQTTEGIRVSSPFSDMGAGGEHTASQWQVHPSNVWLNPDLNTGEDRDCLDRMPSSFFLCLSDTVHAQAALSEPICIPTKIKEGLGYYGRVRHCNRIGNWSDWSEPVWCDSLEGQEVPSGTDKNLPQITKAYFTELGKVKPLSVIERGKWYDFRMYLSDDHGWDNLAFVNAWFCGDPENSLGNHRNRGGVFSEADNYSISLSLGDRSVFERHKNGEESWHRLYVEQGRYLDNSVEALKIFPGKGIVNTRVRVLPNALVGPWVATCYAANKQLRLSGLYTGLFTVMESAGKERSPISKYLLLGIVLACAIGGIGVVILRKAYPASAPEEAQSEEMDRLSNQAISNRVKKVQDFIQANYHGSISAKDIAKEINVSPHRLNAILTKEIGKTVTQYLIDVRMEKAKELLSHSESTVTEIAFRVGFNSLEHFVRSFRARESKTPAEYRAGKVQK